MRGAYKLDHLHPVKPILFSKFYNFFTFILEANSYYTIGLIIRKENSHNPVFSFICTFHLVYFSRVRVLEVRNILVLKRNLAIVNNFNGIFLVVHISPVVWTRYNVNNNNCV